MILLPGETLEVDYAFEGERGGASVEVMSHGWIRVLTDRESVASSGRFGAADPGTLRAEARRAGFHELGLLLVAFALVRTVLGGDGISAA